MNSIVYRAEVISPAVLLQPLKGDMSFPLGSPEPTIPDSSESIRPPIRHLLIGVPDAVHLTIHRLHQLGYADAGLWSPPMGLPSPELTLTVSSGEVMRVLRRSP